MLHQIYFTLQNLGNIGWLLIRISFCIQLIMMVSCSKTIYTHTDFLGTSQYTLYKNSYKYEENSYRGHFSVKGTYEIKNGQVHFLCKDKSKIPYHYYGGSVLPKENNNYDHNFYVHVSNQLFREPIINANILFIDSLGQLSGQTYTDLDGYATLSTNVKAKYLQIEVFEHAHMLLPFPENADNNFHISLESLKPGGRMSDNCLINHMDVLLEYRKKSKGREIIHFERNGVVFIRSERK